MNKSSSKSVSFIIPSEKITPSQNMHRSLSADTLNSEAAKGDSCSKQSKRKFHPILEGPGNSNKRHRSEVPCLLRSRSSTVSLNDDFFGHDYPDGNLCSPGTTPPFSPSVAVSNDVFVQSPCPSDGPYCVLDGESSEPLAQDKDTRNVQRDIESIIQFKESETESSHEGKDPTLKKYWSQLRENQDKKKSAPFIDLTEGIKNGERLNPHVDHCDTENYHFSSRRRIYEHNEILTGLGGGTERYRHKKMKKAEIIELATLDLRTVVENSELTLDAQFQRPMLSWSQEKEKLELYYKHGILFYDFLNLALKIDRKTN